MFDVLSEQPHIVVRRQWNDWRRATIEYSRFESPHWSNESGGVRARAPRYYVHGYVWCNSIIEGELAHSCSHGEGPHRIKVCIVKGDNNPSVWHELAKQAGPNPNSRKTTLMP